MKLAGTVSIASTTTCRVSPPARILVKPAAGGSAEAHFEPATEDSRAEISCRATTYKGGVFASRRLLGRGPGFAVGRIRGNNARSRSHVGRHRGAHQRYGACRSDCREFRQVGADPRRYRYLYRGPQPRKRRRHGQRNRDHALWNLGHLAQTRPSGRRSPRVLPVIWPDWGLLQTVRIIRTSTIGRMWQCWPWRPCSPNTANDGRGTTARNARAQDGLLPRHTHRLPFVALVREFW